MVIGVLKIVLLGLGFIHFHKRLAHTLISMTCCRAARTARRGPDSATTLKRRLYFSNSQKIQWLSCIFWVI